MGCDHTLEIPGIGTFCKKASLLKRMRGLLGTKPQADPIVLVPCREIHTFGMRYSLDAAASDANGNIIAVSTGLMPNRLWSVPGAVAIFERPQSDKPWFSVGDCVPIPLVMKKG